jgi:quercetin dioxygenase-like cupin family protein
VIVEVGDEEIHLKAGETVRYSADQPHGARNESDEDARTLLVVVSLKELSAMGY